LEDVRAGTFESRNYTGKAPKKGPDASLSTPPSTVTLTGPSGESVQVPITPGNVAQVDELFKRIVEGEPGLDPATVLKIQKLCKGASRAIADVSIQRATNIDLIAAELTKKRSNPTVGDREEFPKTFSQFQFQQFPFL
jgi:hypothetical protein